jgi:hypothetical protein
MEWIKSLPDLAPWMNSLPFLQKIIASAIVVCAVLFLLAIMLTPVRDKAVATILADCHRRALFTRMHAQMSIDAMFSSIGKCRGTLQTEIPKIQSEELQDEAMELLAAVEGIERLKAKPDPDSINKYKLAALQSFRQIAKATGGRYPLPRKGRLAEAVYFTQLEADAPLNIADLNNQTPIDPATGAMKSTWPLLNNATDDQHTDTR